MIHDSKGPGALRGVVLGQTSLGTFPGGPSGPRPGGRGGGWGGGVRRSNSNNPPPAQAPPPPPRRRRRAPGVQRHGPISSVGAWPLDAQLHSQSGRGSCTARPPLLPRLFTNQQNAPGGGGGGGGGFGHGATSVTGIAVETAERRESGQGLVNLELNCGDSEWRSRVLNWVGGGGREVRYRRPKLGGGGSGKGLN